LHALSPASIDVDCDVRHGEGALKISYHVSHEQFSPAELLDLTRHAESVGFDCAFSSDHIQPWTPVQGHAGHLWSWLGAALQGTNHLQFSAITIPGGWRYHPAVVAQAIATLTDMFPGRLPWIALGSGEALNEVMVGSDWPDKRMRNARLREAADIIRRLLAGERVSRNEPIVVSNARLWPQPAEQTPLVGAALGPDSAAEAAQWADGLLTVASDLETFTSTVHAFRQRAPQKSVHAKVDICWAATEQAALEQAHEQWAYQCIPDTLLPTLRTPEDFAQAAADVSPEQVREKVFISSDIDRHIDWLSERAALGLATLDIHNVGREQREFIDAFGRRVLPALRSAGSV
jgi:coenzyme F420-dependent glucose-6-phosphate dehydrogenase